MSEAPKGARVLRLVSVQFMVPRPYPPGHDVETCWAVNRQAGEAYFEAVVWPGVMIRRERAKGGPLTIGWANVAGFVEYEEPVQAVKSEEPTKPEARA